MSGVYANSDAGDEGVRNIARQLYFSSANLITSHHTEGQIDRLPPFHK